MKVGIITFHFVNNFGGVLQAYALRRVVEEQCDVEAEIIDYKNWFIKLTDTIRILPMTVNFHEIKSGLKTIGQRIERKKKFCQFNNNIIKSTCKRYYSRLSLNANPPGDDKYICGSDQIWNPVLTMGISPNYFLKFEADPNKKIAYAPSFGTDGIPIIFHRRISKYIESIGYLSVREKSGQALIKKLTGREAARLIDPTFLLKKEEWGAIGVNPLRTDSSYILIYIMQRDLDVYEYACKLKEQTGLIIIEISRYGYSPSFVDKTIVNVGPLEFLGLFRDAAYICTNSYHGLAYSIIFEKDFCIIPCKRFKARINNLLDLLQIKAVDENDNWDNMTAFYDKKYVRDVIERERKQSIKYLLQSLLG